MPCQVLRHRRQLVLVCRYDILAQAVFDAVVLGMAVHDGVVTLVTYTSHVLQPVYSYMTTSCYQLVVM